MYRIKDIAEVHSGITLRKDKNQKSDKAYALIQLGDLDDYHRIKTGNLNRTREVIPKERHLLQPDDIIFSSKGEYNFATVIPEGLKSAVAVSTFLVLKDIDPVVQPEYLAWYINSKKGQEYLSQVRKRTSIPYVSKTNFVEIPVAIPSMETQELIVKINNLKIQEQELRQVLQEKRKKLIDALLLDHIKKERPVT